MLTSVIRSSRGALRRQFSTVEVTNVASVLKMNVGNEETAAKLDQKMKAMSKKMEASPGLTNITRQVCKGEWAYELSFMWDSKEGFGAWKESELQKEVHADYEAALRDCGIELEDVYAGARVTDMWLNK